MKSQSYARKLITYLGEWACIILLGDAEDETRKVPGRLQCYEGTRPGTKMMEDDAVMIFGKPMKDYLQRVENANRPTLY